jgi:anti-sigma factor ChrR (cupin superfamily)
MAVGVHRCGVDRILGAAAGVFPPVWATRARPTVMKTREQALRDLGDLVAEIGAVIERLTPEEAARRAWHPGGPSVDVLADQIRDGRAYGIVARAE